MFIDISSGGTFFLLLDDKGNVTSCGDNSYGTCNVPLYLPVIRKISAGHVHSLALDEKGKNPSRKDFGAG